MDFFKWIIENFGFLFGGVFLIYLYFMLRRMVLLFDVLRYLPSEKIETTEHVRDIRGLDFLLPLYDRLSEVARSGEVAQSVVVDAIWSEVDRQVSVHFTALQGYVHTLILMGFAGTIFGAIGAFNTMFQGLSGGGTAAAVFVAAWNDGLATALYTSLGAAVIGAVVLTMLGSRRFMSKAKRLEVIVGLRISEILEASASEPLKHGRDIRSKEEATCPDDVGKLACHSTAV